MAVITAAICSYDRYDLLEKAIESVTHQSLAASEYEIVVVDNSPDRAELGGVREKYRKVKNLSYCCEETPGLGVARNTAFENCGTEFIAYMDDDAVAAQDWLEKLVAAFESFGPEVEVVGGKVEPNWEEPPPPWLDASMWGMISAVDWGGIVRLASETEWFAGTNICLRSSSLIREKGFSGFLGRRGGSSGLLSNEESELVRRLKERGGAAVYQPEAVVKHLVSKERLTQEWFRKRSAWQAVSDFLAGGQPKTDSVPMCMDVLERYMANVPPRERKLFGLMLETEDPQVFKAQLGAVYHMTVAMLSGFDASDT